jgi:pimeloyl-ACP methyl ester carboxylesterase
MATVEANGVTLGVEHFGDAAAPLVLLAGGTTLLSWPDALCEALASGERYVVRYDLRDSGASTTVSPRLRRTHCAILPPTPRPWPTNSMTGRRTSRASA